MFDIGFFEILMIALVCLVVIGPERLPETVRAVGLWIGRLKRSLRETRSEIEKQIGADDIRRQLHNEEVMRSLESSRQQIEGAVREGALPSTDKQSKTPSANTKAASTPEPTGQKTEKPGQAAEASSASKETQAEDSSAPATQPSDTRS